MDVKCKLLALTLTRPAMIYFKTLLDMSIDSWKYLYKALTSQKWQPTMMVMLSGISQEKKRDPTRVHQPLLENMTPYTRGVWIVEVWNLWFKKSFQKLEFEFFYQKCLNKYVVEIQSKEIKWRINEIREERTTLENYRFLV